jgi:hypothetical protein
MPARQCTAPRLVQVRRALRPRDYLHGARFAEETLGAVVRAAWLPDSFGHAATVPDLLAAIGSDSVMFARIDGAPTFYESLNGRGTLRAGSHAAELLAPGSADFVWKGPGGSRSSRRWCGRTSRSSRRSRGT